MAYGVLGQFLVLKKNEEMFLKIGSTIPVKQILSNRTVKP